MSKLRLRLIYKEARQRLHDAKRLDKEGGLVDLSDSAYLLRLLSLELLLKCIYEAVLEKKPGRHHAYEELFRDLPVEFQNKLLALTGERIGPSGLSQDPTSILQEWGKNFINLRYPYEKYEGLSEEEYLSIGKQWIAKGAQEEEATFRYFPNELNGFLHALDYIAKEMVNH
ncbi:MAG: hypothetical protein FP829_04200 [Nitrospirae bacterium]|nr:hypothetical protein [Nitrospirota bacterium]